MKRGGDPASVGMFILYLALLAGVCMCGVWAMFFAPVSPPVR